MPAVGRRGYYCLSHNIKMPAVGRRSYYCLSYSIKMPAVGRRSWNPIRETNSTLPGNLSTGPSTVTTPGGLLQLLLLDILSALTWWWVIHFLLSCFLFATYWLFFGFCSLWTSSHSWEAESMAMQIILRGEQTQRRGVRGAEPNGGAG